MIKAKVDFCYVDLVIRWSGNFREIESYRRGKEEGQSLLPHANVSESRNGQRERVPPIYREGSRVSSVGNTFWCFCVFIFSPAFLPITSTVTGHQLAVFGDNSFEDFDMRCETRTKNQSRGIEKRMQKRGRERKREGRHTERKTN